MASPSVRTHAARAAVLLLFLVTAAMLALGRRAPEPDRDARLHRALLDALGTYPGAVLVREYRLDTGALGRQFAVGEPLDRAPTAVTQFYRAQLLEQGWQALDERAAVSAFVLDDRAVSVLRAGPDDPGPPPGATSIEIAPPPPGTTFYFAVEAGPHVTAWRSYRSDRFGLAFRYPDRYFLLERDLSTPQRARHLIVLMVEAPEHYDVAAGRSPTPREEPPAITVDLFERALRDDTADRWVRDTPDSHFALSPDRQLRRVSLADEDAVSYRWDGLYPGTSVVVARPGWIQRWSVTWLDPHDAIVGDFHRLLESVTFDSPVAKKP